MRQRSYRIGVLFGLEDRKTLFPSDAAALQTIIETGQAKELHTAIAQAIPGASVQIEYDERTACSP